MIRINSAVNKIINESHIVEINVNDSNIEFELINGKLYDIGLVQQRIAPYVFLEVTQDELERLAIHLRRY